MERTLEKTMAHLEVRYPDIIFKIKKIIGCGKFIEAYPKESLTADLIKKIQKDAAPHSIFWRK